MTPKDFENPEELSQQEAEFQKIRKLTEQKKYDEAYERLLVFVKRRKKVTGMQFYLSSLAYFAGKKDEAIEHMRVAIEAFPTSQKASLALINVLAGCGRDLCIQSEIGRFLAEADAKNTFEHLKLHDLVERLRASSEQDQIAAAVRQVLEFDDDWWVNEL